MRKNPLFLTVSASLLIASTFVSDAPAQMVITSGGNSGLGGFTGNTGTGTNNLFNNNGNVNTSTQQGQLNAADLGLNTDNFFQGGVQRQGAIGAQRTNVYGYSLIENPDGAARMTQSTGTAAGANSRNRTNSQTSRRTGSTFGGSNLGLGGGGLGGQQGMLGGNRNNQNTKQRPILRTRISVAPELAENLSTVQSVNQSTSASVLPGTVPQLSNVRVQVNQGTAVMRGRVSGAADRDLAARLMLLDPGVNQVRNELVVGSRPAAITPVEPVTPVENEDQQRSPN